jgi:CheY-like chemotaxis protein
MAARKPSAKKKTTKKAAAPKKGPAKKAATKKAAAKKAPAKAAAKSAAAKTAKTEVKSKAAAKKTEGKSRSSKPAKVSPHANGVDGDLRAARRAALVEAAEKVKNRPKHEPQLFTTPKDVRILVVDDEPEVLELLVPFLEKQGYTVSEALDGDQALEKILTERPNIVVLDVMMPGLSGWEISRYVRERAELDPVRIIMATGIGKETNAATSPLYGADAHIDKPFRLDALHRTVKEVIAKIEAGAY